MRFQTAFLLIYCLCTASMAQAQKIDIRLGPGEIAMNQGWTITVTISNDQFRNYDMFPDVEGFRKVGTSSQSQTTIINGQMSMTQSVIMTYQPMRQGAFTLKPFQMKVNGQVVSSQGMTIRVGPPAQAQPRDPFGNPTDRDPFGDFFSKKETEFMEVKEEAFLALTTSKKEVYAGEGFTTTLSFLIAETNRATMQFYELGEQLTDILKQVRPEGCWEENFNIENIEGERIEINGKGYTQYKIYQAAFYPLDEKVINFPSVGLKMIKYKVARNPSFFGQNSQEDFKTFYTKPVSVQVKPLPPHPLKESIAVGNYRLDEDISAESAETGKSVTYTFRVVGEGNIAGIPDPVKMPDGGLQLFDPRIRQDVNRSGGRVSGAKTFTYDMIPLEPGEHLISSHIYLPYFDPSRGVYDTLRPSSRFTAGGESKRGASMTSNDATSFYDRIQDAENGLQRLDGSSPFRILMNVFLVCALGVSVFLIFKK